MKRSLVLPIAATGLVLSACGSLDANTGSAPALAKLSGSLSNPRSLSVAGSVRVAVVWKYIQPGEFSVAEDLPVQPVFPSAFTIELDGPPPAQAMNLVVFNMQSPQPMVTSTAGGGTGPQTEAGFGVGPSADGGTVSMQSLRPVNMAAGPAGAVRVAIGAVVAYVDQNGNGKLDLVPEDASAFVDKIVASDPDMAIVYIEGPTSSALRDPAGHVPSEGYNLLYVHHCPVSAPSLGAFAPNPACPSSSAQGPTPPVSDAGPCAQDLHWLPISTPYPLVVADTPEVAALMCQSGGLSAPGMGTGSGGAPVDPSVQPAQYPDPCDPNLSCAPDGSDYTEYSCVTISQGVCEGTLTSCTSISYTRPTPVPAGWPCVH